MEAPYLFNSKVDCNVKQLTYPKCVIQDWSISRILPELDELNAKMSLQECVVHGRKLIVFGVLFISLQKWTSKILVYARSS